MLKRKKKVKTNRTSLSKMVLKPHGIKKIKIKNTQCQNPLTLKTKLQIVLYSFFF